MRAGFVDIGSNSVRTMTATLVDGAVAYSEKQVYTTRLAEGLVATGRLSDARMEQSLAVIARFYDEMQAEGAPVYAYATSAVRDALNREAFVMRVRDIIGDHIAVLSGEEEARYAFNAATHGEGGMLDIGGGSTQLVRAGNAVSVPIGCVRAKDICGGVVSLAGIRRALTPALEALFPLAAFSGLSAWSGVGGTITTLVAYALDYMAYNKRAVAGAVVSRETLASALMRLDAIPLAERAKIPLMQRRYDVILHGGSILLFLLERLCVQRLRVSDADGMEGYAERMLLGEAGTPAYASDLACRQTP